MSANKYEKAIIRNADFFISMQDSKGFINIPADEYYGVRGDASLIGHAISIRLYAWVLSGEQKCLDAALSSIRFLTERQDSKGGWHTDSGYSLDAAQCVMEGFCTYERLTGDRQFHEPFVRAVDRMIEGTVSSEGKLLIGNLAECGEYAHFSFMAWKQTGLDRHRIGGEIILQNIMENFDEQEGFWNTAIKPEVNPFLDTLKPCLNPLLRTAVAHSNMKGKTIAKISEFMLPLVMKGNGPQYSLGLMDAECLLDTLDKSLNFPELRKQTKEAIEWVKKYCSGPVEGSLVESKKVPKGKEVYPLKAINDTINASLWPTAAYLLALVGMNDVDTYGEQSQKVADWIISMQDEDGGFITHQGIDGIKFGEKYGNINFYASTALWYYNSIYIRGKEPVR